MIREKTRQQNSRRQAQDRQDGIHILKEQSNYIFSNNNY